MAIRVYASVDKCDAELREVERALRALPSGRRRGRHDAASETPMLDRLSHRVVLAGVLALPMLSHLVPSPARTGMVSEFRSTPDRAAAAAPDPQGDCTLPILSRWSPACSHSAHRAGFVPVDTRAARRAFDDSISTGSIARSPPPAAPPDGARAASPTAPKPKNARKPASAKPAGQDTKLTERRGTGRDDGGRDRD